MAKPTDVPAANEFGQWRSSIAQMKDEGGQPLWPGNKLNDALGTNVNGRNWQQLRDALNAYQKTSPAA